MSTYPGSPQLIKGALIEFSNRFIASIPNIIIFQYNPDTMTRKLEAFNPEGGKDKSAPAGATAQPFDPDESFDLKLELDAADQLEKPELHPVAYLSGVADRIAAIEMLMYPQDDASLSGLLGSVTAGLGGAGAAFVGGTFGGGATSMALGAGAALGGGLIAGGKKGLTSIKVPRGTVPTVLFAWGPGRIVPVRITSFSVEELAYSPKLYPIRATITIGLKMLTPRHIPCSKNDGDKKAIAAYNIYRQQKKGLAAANMANNVESLFGMLPF